MLASEFRAEAKKLDKNYKDAEQTHMMSDKSRSLLAVMVEVFQECDTRLKDIMRKLTRQSNKGETPDNSYPTCSQSCTLEFNSACTPTTVMPIMPTSSSQFE